MVGHLVGKKERERRKSWGKWAEILMKDLKTHTQKKRNKKKKNIKKWKIVLERKKIIRWGHSCRGIHVTLQSPTLVIIYSSPYYILYLCPTPFPNTTYCSLYCSIFSFFLSSFFPLKCLLLLFLYYCFL